MSGPSTRLSLPGLEVSLRRALGVPLPGIAAQIALAPPARPGWDPGQLPPDARLAAALLLLFPRDQRPHLLLTVRDTGLPTHAGQVSLPGGAIEAGETVQTAALREAAEEVGLDSAAVRLLGVLTPLHVPVSGFVVHTVVGLTRATPTWRPAAGEVARLLEVPIDELLDEACVSRMRIRRDGQDRDVPCLRLAGADVWGATAMILAELRALLGPRPPHSPHDT